MPTASRGLAQEVLQTVLDERERNLLRTASHSLERAVGLYGREYEGRKGVEVELERIKEKVERALAARMERAERIDGRSIEGAISDVTGEPSGAPASMNGAGATGSLRSDPPVAAPASSSASTRRGPAPSPASLDALGLKVMELLRERRMTPKRLAAETGAGDRVMKTRLIRMERLGYVERSTENAFDWPGANRHGRPGRVWKLVEEPPGVWAASGLANPTPVKPRGEGANAGRVRQPRAPTALCPHGGLPAKCAVCSPPAQNGSRAGAQVAELDRHHERGFTGGDGTVTVAVDPQKDFDARELWKSLSGGQRRELMLVVLGSSTFAETVRQLPVG